MKRKLLIYAHYYAPDAASTGQILQDMAEGMKDDFDVTVICTVPSYTGVIAAEYKEKKIYEEELNGVRILRVPVPEFTKSSKKSRIKNLLAYYTQAKKATGKCGPQDYVFTISQPPVMGGMLGLYGKKKIRTANGDHPKFIYCIQDFNPEQIEATGYVKMKPAMKIAMSLDKKSCRKSDLVITVGRDLVDTLKNRFAGETVPDYTMINNWIDEKQIYPLDPGDPGIAEFKQKYGLEGKFLIMYSGNDGLSAQSAFSMISGLLYAFALGTGATLRMLASVFFGEEDKDSLRRLLRMTLSKTVPMSLVVTAVVLLLSGPVTLIFFPDKTTEVYRLTRQLFIICSCCIPFIVLAQVIANYLQACGHNVYVNILSVFDGFFAMVIPSLILAPKMGALGVWLANPIGIALTLLLSLCYACVFNRRFPRGDDFLMLRPGCGVPDEDRLDIPVRSMSDVTGTAVTVQDFCEKHGLDSKTSLYAALCLEEMAGNVVDHGFTKDEKDHMIEAHVTYKDGEVMLRIKDDCVPFDPMERADLLSGDDLLRNIGIRMVSKLAKEMTYQNLIGLNVLTIRL